MVLPQPSSTHSAIQLRQWVWNDSFVCPIMNKCRFHTSESPGSTTRLVHVFMWLELSMALADSKIKQVKPLPAHMMLCNPCCGKTEAAISAHCTQHDMPHGAWRSPRCWHHEKALIFFSWSWSWPQIKWELWSVCPRNLISTPLLLPPHCRFNNLVSETCSWHVKAFLSFADFAKVHFTKIASVTLFLI